jgi:hypothetical protein
MTTRRPSVWPPAASGSVPSSAASSVPLEAVEVEVVRRLVEAEDVEAGKEQRRQARLRGLAPGKRLEALVEAPVQSETGTDAAGAYVEVVRSERDEPLECLRVRLRERRLLAQPRRQSVELGLGSRDPRAPREVAE